MEWYHYFFAFWSGVFLTNAVPHFVQGISGNKFPTVFSRPRGQGLSSPTVNVVWALINIVIGYALLMFAKISSQEYLSLILFFMGIALISLRLSKRFSTKHEE